MYLESLRQMTKTLRQIDTWLDKATEHAKARAFDPTNYVGLRLAPDQFAFARQIQIACDTVKLGAARLAGTESPAFADDERTLDDLRARIAKTVAYVESLGAAALEGAATRVITQPRWEGKTMTGADYFREHVTPNFYFHAAHAYAILRHAGVALGKKDYLGALTQKPAAS